MLPSRLRNGSPARW